MNGYDINIIQDGILHDFLKKSEVGIVKKRNMEILIILNEYLLKCVSLKFLFFCFAKVFDLKMFFSLSRSMKKTESLMLALKYKLKEVPLTIDEYNAFNYFFKKFDKRVEYINVIIRENLKETIYYPFYRDLGISLIDDFNNFGSDDEKKYAELFAKAYDNYCKTHQKEIEEYKPIVEELCAKKDAFRNKKVENYKQEKAIVKNLEKIEKDEIKFMEKQKELQKTKDRRFNEYYGIVDKVRYILRFNNNTYLGKREALYSSKENAMKFFSKDRCIIFQTKLANKGYTTSVEKIILN